MTKASTGLQTLVLSPPIHARKSTVANMDVVHLALMGRSAFAMRALSGEMMLAWRFRQTTPVMELNVQETESV